MLVPKSFRFSEFSNAILEILSEREGKTQTAILEELLKGYVVWDLEQEESMEIMKAADLKIHAMKAKRDVKND